MRIEQAEPLELLRKYWGYEHFRGVQESIIHSILSGHDTLGLMPTGGGKSVTFQVPALAQEGVCIVVTPLIALMSDQVEHMRHRGIPAAAIHSGLSHSESLRHLDNAVLGAYKLLYVSPERLSTELFQTKLRKMRVSFIAVDEAHCISQWGYDFRPAYLQIAAIRKFLPGVPLLALTATATRTVVTDICRLLSSRQDEVPADRNDGPQTEELPKADRPAEVISGFNIYRTGFSRPNLSYVVRETSEKNRELIHILKSIPGSAIVYVRHRNATKILCDELNGAGISSIFYHAGLPHADKEVRQLAWQTNDVRVMVATNAFGMGIDKPDVRLVVHVDCPDCLESYFQEAGRAGRDGKPAYAVLLCHSLEERALRKRISSAFPSREYICRVYDEICYFFQLALGDGFQVSYEFDEHRFCAAFSHHPLILDNALAILSRAGYIDHRPDDEMLSRLVFLVQRDDLYQIGPFDKDTENVMRNLLRHYCGLFCDYVYVEESLLAVESGLTASEVYEILKSLNRRRILHYIPRKKTPRITFLTRRVESEKLVLPPEVYEGRKRQFESRLQQMIDYAKNRDYCRSRFLLEYFGDYTGADCGCCDVCRDRNKSRSGESRSSKAESVKQWIAQLLADREYHFPYEFEMTGISPQQMAVALQEMVEAGEVQMNAGRYRMTE